MAGRQVKHWLSCRGRFGRGMPRSSQSWERSRSLASVNEDLPSTDSTRFLLPLPEVLVSVYCWWILLVEGTTSLSFARGHYEESESFGWLSFTAEFLDSVSSRPSGSKNLRDLSIDLSSKARFRQLESRSCSLGLNSRSVSLCCSLFISVKNYYKYVHVSIYKIKIKARSTHWRHSLC